MSRVVAVIGGGISGLTAARCLASSPGVEVVVLEAADRCGGKILTGEFRGLPVELGPDNFLTRDPSAAHLCRQLGLGEDLVAPATSSASVVARGHLRPLPAGLVLGIPTDLKALARSRILSGPGLARAALDLVAPGSAIRSSSVGLRPSGPGNAGPEWTAGSILQRRLGHEVVERLVDPLLGGINAGSVDHLSLAVVAPQVARALAGRNSVIRSLRARLPAPHSQAGAHGDDQKPAGAWRNGPMPIFLGLRGGLSRLVEGLVAGLRSGGVDLRTGSEVTALRFDQAGYQIETEQGFVVADAVVLGVPANVAARLLVDGVPAAGAELSSIPYAGVALATFAFPSGSISRLPKGSGFLVPRCEGRLLTGCTVISAKWPESARPGEIVIRASTGRYGDDRATKMSDDELTGRVLGELKDLIGTSAEPLSSLVHRWPRAFPQYLPGHLGRLDRARSALSALPPIELVGAALGGIGIPACVTSGERAAMTILDRLRE